jgi:PAS domain S-box-containing protein
MEDKDKTKAQLISELRALRRRVAELETLTAEYKRDPQKFIKSQQAVQLETPRQIGLELTTQVVNNVREVIFQTDLTGRWTFLNRAWTEITGFNISQSLGQNFLDFVHPDDRQRNMAEFEPLIKREKEYCRYEVRYLTQTGELRWLEVHARLIFDDRGEVSGTSGTLSDVTRRRQAEETLRAERNLLWTVIDNLPDAIYIKNRESQFKLVNTATVRKMGFATAESLIGKTDFDFHPRELAAQFYRDEQQAMASGQVLANKEELVIDQVGNQSWLLVTKVPLREGKGQVTGLVGISRDITERRRMREALQQSEARFRATFEQAAVGIAHLDLEGHWLRVNQKLCDILGYSKEALLTKSFQDITAPEDLKIDLENTRKVLANELQTYTLEKRYFHQNGSLIWVNLTVSLVRSSAGEPEYFIAVIEDITRHKQLEEQLQQLKRIEAVSTLAGGIAHYFNNVLTVINGNCALILSEDNLDTQLREDIEKIHRAGQRVANLTHQLLAFSRQQLLQPRVVSLNAVVSRTVQLLQPSLPEEIRFTTLLEATPDWVHIDPNQFEQVIEHLVSNACDAMPQGGQLTLETGNVYLSEKEVDSATGLQPGPYVVLLVSDTGSGIDDATQPRIFEPFFTTKEVGGGAGLGLPVVYGVVKQSGGYIQFQSQPGQGTTFKTFLPQVEVNKPISY